MLRFAGVRFDDTLLSAHLEDVDREVRFTRAERAVLEAFLHNPGRLLTRDQLLDAIGGEGSDMSDRRVDFVINRLRGKLMDPARQPRLIETRYLLPAMSGRDANAWPLLDMFDFSTRSFETPPDLEEAVVDSARMDACLSRWGS